MDNNIDPLEPPLGPPVGPPLDPPLDPPVGPPSGPLSAFETYMTTFLNDLDIINGPTILRDIINTYSNTDKYKIIESIENHLTTLKNADNAFKELKQGALKNFYENNNEIKSSWDATMLNLAKLQGLVILKKIKSGKCDDVIAELLKAFNNKISAVNNILTENLVDD